ncbi:MAG: DNA repair protein [Clostridia bacterium]|nr:DNA repair protein [Clostridia bacterium]
MNTRYYLCIDLKSFFASVECVERGLDPMKVNLIVADPERSEKTICLAITPAMKELGVKNRCRVFEIPKNIKYITAPPRMQKYIDYSAKIYGVYLKYIAPEDMHIYSIDEVFLDVTNYLGIYKCTPKELAVSIMKDVFKTTGIRATCGIGTNLYLAKIALDITAKHSPDFIGELNRKSYCEKLWDHTPLTDFWRIGIGTANRLQKYGITTMGQIAKANEDLLYKEFGVDAELLIDHAYGIEPTTIADIKSYKPKNHGISSGQVLMRDYTFREAKIVFKEMLDNMCLELINRELVTNSITFYIIYSNGLEISPTRGNVNLGGYTQSEGVIISSAVRVFDEKVSFSTPIRKINISFNNLKDNRNIPYQTNLFQGEHKAEELIREKAKQHAVAGIKTRFGKNAILKALDFQNGATARERNHQIGGHKSGM